MSDGTSAAQNLLGKIRRVHERIRASVLNACEAATAKELTEIVSDADGDTIYAIDRISESTLVEAIELELAPAEPVVLIAEGIASESVVLPRGSRARDAAWRVIVDPIDGTRHLMYQKRSGWILTGVAPNRGDQTSLSDIELAVQTEIPTLKQHLADTLWAVRGHAAQGERWNRLSGERTPLNLVPSRAETVEHGFATVCRYFPGARDVLAAIDDEIVTAIAGPVRPGKALCFEDQYASTAGQLYELTVGHDRFVADLRPLLLQRRRERPSDGVGICCHPYDLCTELIARQAGVVVTGVDGRALNAPLNVSENVGWIGYANPNLRAKVEPVLQRALRTRGLLDGSAG